MNRRSSSLGAIVCAWGALSFGASGFAQSIEPRAEMTSPTSVIRKVALEWAEVGNAKFYELEIASDPEFKVVQVSRKVTEAKQIVELVPGAYFYRVRAIDRGDFPGQWTPTQELFLNPKPPELLFPKDQEVIDANLPDTGLLMGWKSAGMGIRYLIEIRAQDEKGQFSKPVVKQEVSGGTTYPFFPAQPGIFQWSVHTLGAGGDETGGTRVFTLQGVEDPKDPGQKIVRYLPPWYRRHWFVYGYYGQSQLSYSIIDQDLRGLGSFSGLAGFTGVILNWEWHDPVEWLGEGFPWAEADYQVSRQTVLSESVILPSMGLRLGVAYNKWLRGWRFSPILEAGRREISLYQPRSEVEAVRSVSTRFYFGAGAQAEWELKSFLVLGALLKARFESGGEGGVSILPGTGDQLDTVNRAGELLSSTAVEVAGTCTLLLGSDLKIQGKLGIESFPIQWVPRFPTQVGGKSASGNTELEYQYMSFSVRAGLRF